MNETNGPLKRKQLFVDSADLGEISEAISQRIRGVTMNPALLAKSLTGKGILHGDPLEELIVRAEQIMAKLDSLESPSPWTLQEDLHISVEPLSLDPIELQREAAAISTRLKKKSFEVWAYLKVPAVWGYLDTISDLRKQNVKVNATACATAIQAKLAVDAGAHCVSFFYRRMCDDCGNKAGPLAEISLARRLLPDNVQIICGSIRDVQDILDCWIAGADIVTAPVTVLRQCFENNVTKKALADFKSGADSWRKSFHG